MITLTTDAKFDDLERLIDRINRPGNGNTRKIADAVTMGFQDNFTRQSSGAGAWARLAPATLVDRQRKGFAAGPTLVRTGGLRASYVSRGGASHYERISQSAVGLTIEAGSDDYRAPFHERGTAKMPARPISLLGESSENRIVDTIEFVLGQIDREFLR